MTPTENENRSLKTSRSTYDSGLWVLGRSKVKMNISYSLMRFNTIHKHLSNLVEILFLSILLPRMEPFKEEVNVGGAA